MSPSRPSVYPVLWLDVARLDFEGNVVIGGDYVTSHLPGLDVMNQIVDLYLSLSVAPFVTFN